MLNFLRVTPIALLLTGLATSSAVFASQPIYNQISLRAEASKEVAHDQMQVILYSEAQDSDPARLADNITKTLNAALEKARQHANISIKLGNRSSHPIYDSKGQKITAWRERAELRLESTDFSTLSGLTGELLHSLKMANMQFDIAAKTRLSSEDELLKEAIAAFQSRAKLVSDAFGGKSYKVVNLNLNSNGFARPPMYARAAKMYAAPMASDAISAPEVEAGSSQVSIIADGVIEITLP